VLVVFYHHRGAWCPYCNITLRTYERDLPAGLDRLGVALVAISPPETGWVNPPPSRTARLEFRCCPIRPTPSFQEPLEGDRHREGRVLRHGLPTPKRASDVADSNADSTAGIPISMTRDHHRRESAPCASCSRHARGLHDAHRGFHPQGIPWLSCPKTLSSQIKPLVLQPVSQRGRHNTTVTHAGKTIACAKSNYPPPAAMLALLAVTPARVWAGIPVAYSPHRSHPVGVPQ
jgi:hypothetical protein